MNRSVLAFVAGVGIVLPQILSDAALTISKERSPDVALALDDPETPITPLRSHKVSRLPEDQTQGRLLSIFDDDIDSFALALLSVESFDLFAAIRPGDALILAVGDAHANGAPLGFEDIRIDSLEITPLTTLFEDSPLQLFATAPATSRGPVNDAAQGQPAQIASSTGGPRRPPQTNLFGTSSAAPSGSSSRGGNDTAIGGTALTPDDVLNIAAVSLPAGLPLVLAGLGAFALIRTRQKHVI